MKRAFTVAALVSLAAVPLLAGGRATVSGAYVEARTAEVFTGGCIMNSEAETMGRQAVLAWKVDRGWFDGIALDGLSVVAALAGDRNLGMPEMGGEIPEVKSALFVDERANAAQRLALVAMVHELSHGIVGTIVQVAPAPIAFADHGSEIAVSAPNVTLEVNKHMTHDPTCGAQQWFHPLSAVNEATIGVADQHLFTGSVLGTKWSDPNKRSAFFGTFSY